MQERLKERRSFRGGPLFLGIAFQVFLLLLSIFIGVVIPQKRSEPAFTVKETVYLPQRELEHKVAVADFQNATRAPKSMERIAVSELLSDELPVLPILGRMEYDPFESDNMLVNVDALFDSTGLMASLKALNTKKSEASLFGINDSFERVVVLFDDGGSVLNKAKNSNITIDKIKEEVIGLVDQLNANTLFGFVNFVRQVGTFKDYLIAANRANKEEAKRWIASHFGTRKKATGLQYNPDGIQGALQLAFSMEPDVVFIISDGDFQRSPGGDVPWEELSKTLSDLQSTLPQNARIHFVGFQVEDAHSVEMARIVKKYGGTFRKIVGQ